MTDNQLDSVAQGDDASNKEAMPFSVGTTLREARAHLGLSVGEVSHHIKFAPRQIEALEADDFEHLPETTFLRGFVRSYARLLQLDSAPLLAALPHAPEQILLREEKVQPETPYPNIYTERKQNIIWLGVALAAAAILALIAWLLGDNQKEQNPAKITVSDAQNSRVDTLVPPDIVPVSSVPEATPVSAVLRTEPVAVMPGSEKDIADKPAAVKPVAEKSPVEKPPVEKPLAEKPVEQKRAAEINKTAELKSVSEPAPPASKPVNALIATPVVKPASTNNIAGEVAVRMTFDADSWVEITDKNGKVLLSQLNRAGTEQAIKGSPPFSLTIGYVKGVHLYYKGKAVDLAPHDIADVAHLTLE